MTATTKHCTRCGGEFPDEALFCPLCGEPQARSADDPLVSTVLADRYLLLERIGQGSSGTVYRAEHVTLRRKAAVKILHHQLCSDDNAIERFRREATTVAAIDNQHILDVLDFGRAEDGRLYFAMELLEGETLAAVLAREGRLAHDRTVDIMLQVGEALTEAHGMGYVHRDLRPRNIFLSRKHGRDDFVKLLDFGLAKLVRPDGEAAQTQLGMTFGDPRYMSPEQARGEPVDRRADIYSLGVIGYEMVTGEPPFSGGPPFELLTRHIEETPRRPRVTRPDVPPFLENVILRALAKRPDDRFATVLQMMEALRAGLAEHTLRPPVRRDSGLVPAAPRASETARGLAPAMLPQPGEPAPRAAEPLPRAGEPPQRPSERLARAGEPPQQAGEPFSRVGEPPQPREPLPLAGDVSGRLRTASAHETLAYVPQAARPAGTAAPAPTGALPGARPQELPRTEAEGAPSWREPSGPAPAPSWREPPGPAPAWREPSGPAPVPPYAPSASAELRPPEASAPTSHEASIPTALIGGQAPPPSSSDVWFAEGERQGVAPDTRSLESSVQPDMHRRRPWHVGLWVLVGVSAVGLSIAAFVLWSGAKDGSTPQGISPARDGSAPAGSRAMAALDGGRTAAEPPAPAGTPPASPQQAPPQPPDTRKPGDAPAQAAARASRPSEKTAAEPRREERRPKEASRETGGKAEPKTPSPPPQGDTESGGETPQPPAERGQDKRVAELLASARENLRRGAHAKAAGEFASVRELDPRNADAIAGLGEVAFEQGQYQEATVHLKAALRLQPRRASFHVSLGNAYYKLGRVKDAIAEYKTALKLDPKNEEARTALGIAQDRLRGGPP